MNTHQSSPQTNTMRPSGIWLPLVTPFRDGVLDEPSVRRLVRHYASQPVDGLILAATTGEGLTLNEEETERLVATAADEKAACRARFPIYLGLSGSDSRKLVEALHGSSAWPVVGYLITCPYYVRPSQEGLFQRFTALADNTPRPILIYNIPYRTGVNLENDRMLRLAERTNIVGVKDCSANAAQSFDLLRRRPAGFTVLTGDDAQFYDALSHGADGGILMSAHVAPRAFADVRAALAAGDLAAALSKWRDLVDLPGLLFSEPSPAPVKYGLWRLGLIESPEVRLPMTPATPALARRIDSYIASQSPLAKAAAPA